MKTTIQNGFTLTAVNRAVLTMTSREIAELTGKEHKNVTVDVVKMLSDLGEDALNFQRIYFDSMNRPQVEYALDRELTDTLLTGYSAVLRRKVIARWRELEAKQGQFDPATLTRSDILRLALESEEARIQAVFERDKAIATKAEIGSRREATAMSTASAAVRQAERLKVQLSLAHSHATIRSIERALGKTFDWRPISAWCLINQPEKRYAVDPLFGQVRTWPAGSWLAVYGINIGEVMEAKND